MPTVFRAHGLRFMIFTDDHLPPHVHVRGDGEVRIALDLPCRVLTSKGMAGRDVARALDAVRQRRGELFDVWSAIHG